MCALNLLPSSPVAAADTDQKLRPLLNALSEVGVFREMTDNALQGIMLHHSHRPLYVNSAWASLHGMTVHEVMDLTTLLDLIHQSDRKRLTGYARERLAGGHPPNRYRYRALHKSGRSIWLEQFVRLIDWQGHQVILSTIIDVDDQEKQVVALREQRRSMKLEVRQHSKALVQSARELQAHQRILDQISERIFVVGLDYRLRLSNRANLDYRKLTRDQLIGRHIREIVGDVYFDDVGRVRLDRAFAGQTDRYENREIDPEGQCVHTQVTVEPFREADGAIGGAILSIRDITDHKTTEEQCRLFASVIEQSRDRISVIDLDYHVRLTNQANIKFHRRSADTIVGHHLAEIVGQKYFDEFSKPALDRCFKGESVQFRRPNANQDGTLGTLDVALEPYRDADGAITGAVARMRDVSETQTMSDKLAYQARYDQLTGLLNRRAFEMHLEESIADATNHQHTDALCFIDLDQFKIVNDTVGHLAGDELLLQVAKVLSSRLHEGDVLARFGGDEFVLLFHRCSLRRAKRAAERLIAALSAFRFFHDGLMFRIGASIGITAINQEAVSAGDVMTQADLACYAAKDNGRNQVQIYKKRDALMRRRQDDMYRAGGIKTALDEDRFVLFSQPIAPVRGDHDAAEDAPEHVEILLRMLDERRQIIKPYAFIPAAERYGFMAELDRWVIRKTVDQLTRFDEVLANTNVSINLSGVTLNDETSLDFIRRTLTASGLAPERISFEITETAAIRNMATTEAFMAELREWGCRFALDDFGSGLSSLKYLKRLPVDVLKIDGAFVRDLPKDAESRAMVKAINQMARDLCIQTVAEGVESLSTLETLKDLGIDYVQGYAIGIPAPLLPDAAAGCRVRC